MRLRFDIVDVFTDRPFAGNQLAVVHGSEQLSTEQCQAIAQEFGFSETTFPGVRDGSSYDVRIFTPELEVPFAGHPTLGTAWVLRRAGLLRSAECVQHCPAGEVGVRFGDETVELSATPRVLVGPLGEATTRAMLTAVGLTQADLAGEAYVAGAGLSFAYLPVTEDAVGRAVGPSRAVEVPEARDAEAFLGDVDVHAVVETPTGLQVRSRVFVPGGGVPEDPATGSAAAGLGMVLVASGRLPDGGRYDVTQGVEMGRPSSLAGRVEAADGRATRCHVAGRVRAVASGEIEVPAA